MPIPYGTPYRQLDQPFHPANHNIEAMDTMFSTRSVPGAYNGTVERFGSLSILSSLAGKATKIIFKIILILNSKFRGPCLKPLLQTILTRSLSLYSYQKDERAKPGNLLTKLFSFSLPTIKYLSLFPGLFTRIYSSTMLSTSPLSLSCSEVSQWVSQWVSLQPGVSQSVESWQLKLEVGSWGPVTVREPEILGTSTVGSRYQATWLRTLVCVECIHELYKCSINPIINPKPLYSHNNTWQYYLDICHAWNGWYAKDIFRFQARVLRLGCVRVSLYLARLHPLWEVPWPGLCSLMASHR
jgi:hypothetical protein